MPTTGKRREASDARPGASLLPEADFLADMMLLQMLSPLAPQPLLLLERILLLRQGHWAGIPKQIP